MQTAGKEYLCAEIFEKVWRSCFSYIKIRVHKAVTGKCDACCCVSHFRRTFHDSLSREYITSMHALYRTMYMGERLEYYKRRQEALLYSDRVWSLISNGMAQHHCQLPYLAGMKDTDRLPQHLQGVDRSSSAPAKTSGDLKITSPKSKQCTNMFQYDLNEEDCIQLWKETKMTIYRRTKSLIL